MAFSNKKGEIFNDINITPLTDIFLVLLIIMMFMAPMFQSVDKNIEIPEINSGVAVEEDSQNAVLSISKDGHYYINSKEINPQNLTNELTAIVGNIEEKKIIVKADTNVKSKEIIEVVRAAQDSGFEKLVVAGEPLSKKAQKQLEQVQNTHPTSNINIPTEDTIQPNTNLNNEYHREDDFTFEE